MILNPREALPPRPAEASATPAEGDKPASSKVRRIKRSVGN